MFCHRRCIWARSIWVFCYGQFLWCNPKFADVVQPGRISALQGLSFVLRRCQEIILDFSFFNCIFWSTLSYRSITFLCRYAQKNELYGKWVFRAFLCSFSCFFSAARHRQNFQRQTTRLYPFMHNTAKFIALVRVCIASQKHNNRGIGHPKHSDQFNFMAPSSQ